MRIQTKIGERKSSRKPMIDLLMKDVMMWKASFWGTSHVGENERMGELLWRRWMC